MKPPWHKTGWPGWAVLAVGVLAWDLLAPESMSHAFRRTRQHPASFVAAAVTWTYLTAHLFEIIPRDYDVLDLAVEFHRRKEEAASCAVASVAP